MADWMRRPKSWRPKIIDSKAGEFFVAYNGQEADVKDNLCSTHWSRRGGGSSTCPWWRGWSHLKWEMNMMMSEMISAEERSYQLCEWLDNGDRSCRCVISQSHPHDLWSLIILWSENQMTLEMMMVSYYSFSFLETFISYPIHPRPLIALS